MISVARDIQYRIVPYRTQETPLTPRGCNASLMVVYLPAGLTDFLSFLFGCGFGCEGEGKRTKLSCDFLLCVIYRCLAMLLSGGLFLQRGKQDEESSRW